MGIDPTLLGSRNWPTPSIIGSFTNLARLVGLHSGSYVVSLTGFFVVSGPPTWKRLVNSPFITRESIPLIKAIFSDKTKIGVVQSLRGDDAQSFIDTIAEVPLHALRVPRKNVPTDFNSNTQPSSSGL